MNQYLWLVFALLAGLCWGTYVPLIQFGGKTLGSPWGSYLCVGVAYFLIAIVVPIILFMLGEKQPTISSAGITFATLAGVAGALGALCVIFANRYSGTVDNRMYIAPIIFALAPLLNTLISLVWHPSKGVMHFGLENSPGWKLYVGILLTGIGAALVLYSKEESEQAHAKKPTPPVTEITRR